MKPNTVNQISLGITLNSETPQQHLSKLEVDAMRGHIKDYHDAGVPVPDAVREKAEKMGIEAICLSRMS